MNFTDLRSGTSVEGDEIKAYKSGTKGKKYIYLLGGTHGDEVEGVYVMEKLFTWLKEQDLDLSIIALPRLNVDGIRAGNRTNSNGVDLNRNLPASNWSSDFSKDRYNPGPAPLSEPENNFLVKLFEKFTPGFIISFHTWKPILNYNGDALEVCELLHKYNNYPIQDDLGYATPGSLGSYVPDVFNAPVLTLECPELSDDLDLEAIWQQNAEGLKELFLKKSHLLTN